MRGFLGAQTVNTVQGPLDEAAEMDCSTVVISAAWAGGQQKAVESYLAVDSWSIWPWTSSYMPPLSK